jgi:prophage antirepressor-like protein
MLNELGIYRLIMRSNKPEAEAFQDWVYDIIETLRRDVLKLKEYEAFRLMDKEHQKAAMKRLNDSLREPVKVDYIKANAIADKAASTLHGFPTLIQAFYSFPRLRYLKTRQHVVKSLSCLACPYCGDRPASLFFMD